jgi:hypothetical protein
MIRRRSFLIGSSGIVAAPVFAHLALPVAATHQPQATATPSPASNAYGRPAKHENTSLRIDGWEGTPDAGSDVWVQINSSWRANWR